MMYDREHEGRERREHPPTPPDRGRSAPPPPPPSGGRHIFNPRKRRGTALPPREESGETARRIKRGTIGQQREALRDRTRMREA